MPPRKRKPHELCRQARRLNTGNKCPLWAARKSSPHLFAFAPISKYPSLQISTFSFPGVTCHWPKATLPFKAAGGYLSSCFKAMQPSAVISSHRQDMLPHLCLPALSLKSFLWNIHLLLFSSHLLAQLRLAVTHLKYSPVKLPSGNIL